MRRQHNLGRRQTIAELILASASPRRQDLLRLLGVPFTVLASAVAETLLPGTAARRAVISLASAKALAVSAARPDCVVVGADTVVAMDGRLFGKPRDADDAVTMLRALRGRWHRVWTGIAVVTAAQEGAPSGHAAPKGGQGLATLAVRSDVLMRHYSDAEIDRYVATGDPLDKAAAYAIQRSEFSPVAELAGCYANVMGLPLCHLRRLVQQAGIVAPLDPLLTCPPCLGITCSGPFKGRGAHGGR